MEHKTFRSKAPGYILFSLFLLVMHLAKMAMGAHECAVLLHFKNKRFFNIQNQKSLKRLSLFSRQRSKHSIHRYFYAVMEKKQRPEYMIRYVWGKNGDLFIKC